MTLRFRRFLYIAFFIAFLVITPQVILKAKGYRLKFSKNFKEMVRMQKTGIFVLDSKPDNAKIYLNGSLQQKPLNQYLAFILPSSYEEKNYITTPAKIKNLFPGEYTVKLQKEGYWDWEKKLIIKEGESTFAEDIYLFKNTLPQLVKNEKISYLTESPDKKQIIFNSNYLLFILNLSSEEVFNLTQATSSVENKISWSPLLDRIIINKKIYQTRNGELVLDISKINPEASYLKWDEANENNLFFILSPAQTLNAYSLENKKIKNLLKEEKIIDYLVKKDNIFVIAESAKKNKLNIYSREGKLERSLDLPFLSNYAFINSEHNLINIRDTKKNILYLINHLSYAPLVEKIENIKYGKWVNDNTLLYANDFEIFIYTLNNKEKTLLTRISSPIKAIFWHPSNNYVIYATDTTINTIELDKREKRNSTELIKIEKISFPFMNKEGNIIYFYSKIGKQEGIYKLILE